MIGLLLLIANEGGGKGGFRLVASLGDGVGGNWQCHNQEIRMNWNEINLIQ